MKEVKGDIWAFHAGGKWVVIPTNGERRATGEAIMGGGLALEAKIAFPHLPVALGSRLDDIGNIPMVWPDYKLITYPTKKWIYQNSDLGLIVSGLDKLKEYALVLNLTEVYLPRLGCGLGRLPWSTVKEAIEPRLDNRFIVVSQE